MADTDGLAGTIHEADVIEEGRCPVCGSPLEELPPDPDCRHCWWPNRG